MIFIYNITAFIEEFVDELASETYQKQKPKKKIITISFNAMYDFPK